MYDIIIYDDVREYTCPCACLCVCVLCICAYMHLNVGVYLGLCNNGKNLYLDNELQMISRMINI